MQINKEADFVLKGDKVIHPLVQTDGLELYYDVKGKKNSDKHKDKLLDMSGQGKDGELTEFDYDGELSGYDGDNGLVFDGVEDTLKMPKLSGIDADNFTYQLNNNILSFTGDEVKTIKNGSVEVGGRNLLPKFTSDRWDIDASSIQDYLVTSEENSSFSLEIILELEPSTEYTITFNTENGRYYFFDFSDGERGRIIYQSRYNNTDSVVETFTTGEETLILLIINNYSRVQEATRKIWDIKLEKGTVATDWTPAPEDLLETTELKGNILGDMEDIVDASPRDRQSGEEVFTEHADDSHVEVEVDGQSYQHAGSGKNLFQKEGIELGPKNVGNSVGDTLYGIKRPNRLSTKLDSYSPVKPNTEYTLSWKIGNMEVGQTDSSNVITDRSGGWKDSSPFTFTTGESTTRVHFNIAKKDNSDILLEDVTDWEIQFEEGAVATEYEPPAPSPDYPIEIHSVNNFDVVSNAGGRNLLLGSGKYSPISLSANNNTTGPIETGVEDGIDWVTGYSVSDNVFYISTYAPQRFESNLGEIYSRELSDYEGTITFSVDVMSEYPLDVAISSYQDDRKKLEPNEWTRIYHTRDNPSGLRGLMATLNPEAPVGTKLYWRNYKIEKGSQATDWTPAPEDITENDNHPLIDKINLSLSEPLRSVGDVKDRLFRDSDGLWKIERNVEETILDGNWSWRHHEFSTTEIDYYETHFGLSSMVHVRKIESTHFSGTLTQNHYPINHIRLSRSGWLNLSIKHGTFNEISELKDWLDNNHIIVNYEVNPEIETLDQELQDKLNTLKSFKDSNYVYTVQNTDNPHKEQLIPTLHATFNSKDYLKETRTLTNLLIWARELSDEELIHHNKLFLNRFNMRSDRGNGEPVEQTLNLLHGGMVGHSLEQNYTINI